MSFAGTPMLTELARLCRGGASGTMFVATTDGHQLRIGLSRGLIVNISSLTLRGAAALNAMSTLAPKGFRFAEGYAAAAQTDLPPTPAILSFLQDDTQDGTAKPPVPQQGQAAPQRLDPSVLAMVTEELTEYVGPIAEILIEEVQDKAGSLDNLLNLLSARLDSVEEAAQFAARVRARLA